MEFVVSIGRTLARPWKESISPTTAIVVVVFFAIVVWWTLDSLRVISSMEKFIKESV